MADLQALRILLVEDDLLIAMEMEDFLREQGCEIVGPFARLADAMEAGAVERLDGAVIDLNLRGELSFPLIELLGRRAVPVILCSGYVDLPEIKEQLKGIATLSKPCNQDNLLKLMKQHFVARHSSVLSG
jgi:DNA-binding NtrC family response regulator